MRNIVALQLNAGKSSGEMPAKLKNGNRNARKNSINVEKNKMENIVETF